jgi:hypothetical protein
MAIKWNSDADLQVRIDTLLIVGVNEVRSFTFHSFDLTRACLS